MVFGYDKEKPVEKFGLKSHVGRRKSASYITDGISTDEDIGSLSCHQKMN